MYTRRQLGSQLAALAATLAIRPGSAHAAAQVLRFACISGATSESYAQELEPFARAVEAGCGGRIEMALKPVGTYGKPAELFGMVERGDIEIASSVQGYYPGRFPQSSAIELPLLFTNSLSGSKALTALYKEGLLDKDYASVKVLSLYVTAPYSIFTTGKKITSVRDLRGLRIRVPSPTMGLPLARLGAIPLGTPASMIGDAIASGTIDAMAYGMDTSLGTFGPDGKSLAEHMSVVVDLDFAAPALMTVMNRATWDGLPPDIQTVLETQGAESVLDGARIRDHAQAAAREKFKSDPHYTYIDPSPELRGEIEHAMARSYDDWQAGMTRLGIDGDHLLTRTRELIRQFTVAEK